MDIGRKVYYNKSTGEVFWDKGEMSGCVKETTFEQDCETMPTLSILADIIDVVQYDYGYLRSDFTNTNKYIINVLTKRPIFYS